MTSALEVVSKKKWQELLLRLEEDLSKGMTSFVDEDLNMIGQFLHEHRSLIPEDRYCLGIRVLNACVQKTWTGESMKILKELLNGVDSENL